MASWLLAKTLTTGVGIKEEHRSPKNGAEHSVVENPGGIDADDVEQNTSQQVHQENIQHQRTIYSHTLGVRQRTGRSVRYGHVCLSEAATVHFNLHHGSVDTTQPLRTDSPEQNYYTAMHTISKESKHNLPFR